MPCDFSAHEKLYLCLLECNTYLSLEFDSFLLDSMAVNWNRSYMWKDMPRTCAINCDLPLHTMTQLLMQPKGRCPLEFTFHLVRGEPSRQNLFGTLVLLLNHAQHCWREQVLNMKAQWSKCEFVHVNYLLLGIENSNCQNQNNIFHLGIVTHVCVFGSCHPVLVEIILF